MTTIRIDARRPVRHQGHEVPFVAILDYQRAPHEGRGQAIRRLVLTQRRIPAPSPDRYRSLRLAEPDEIVTRWSAEEMHFLDGVIEPGESSEDLIVRLVLAALEGA